MTPRPPATLAVLANLLLFACGGHDDHATSSPEETTGVGGRGPGTGGVSVGSGGGEPMTGGAAPSTGGVPVPSGGTTAETGGAAPSAGGSSPESGGSDPGSGGSAGSGGDLIGASGGDPARGGAVGTGGSQPAQGGSSGSGGDAESAQGGSAGSGGDGGAPEDGGATVGGGGAAPALGGATGTGGGQEDPVCEVPPPSEHQPNPSVGGGGSPYDESDHFLLFGLAEADTALDILEAAHQCFVEDWCWRSPGLSVHSDDGPYYKFNVYAEPSLSAGGYMQYDYSAGIAYIEVLGSLIDDAAVTVHEYGHALTLTEHGWVDQKNTGFWWESVANFVADTLLTSPLCEAARRAHGLEPGRTLIELDTVIGRSYWTICMNQNYYQAWPFFTYLTNNPDGFPGLGRMALPDLFRNHLGNNETPLHVLERLAAPVTVPTILGRYWARMAYLDIGHPQAQSAFFNARGRLDFDHLTPVGDQTYAPVAGRAPRYGGANIVPLDVTGEGTVSVQVTNLGNGRPESNFVATLSIRAGDGVVRYVDLPGGVGQATVGSDEEVSLVVVNAPDELYLYDPEFIGAEPSSDPANTALEYEVRITGATPAG